MNAVIFCGSRELDQLNANHVGPIQRALDKYGPRTVIIHGNARGADQIVDTFARMKAMDVLRMPALWSKHGKQAGMIRNHGMLAVLMQLGLVGYVMSIEGFPLLGAKNIGTLAMLRIAAKEYVGCCSTMVEK